MSPKTRFNRFAGLLAGVSLVFLAVCMKVTIDMSKVADCHACRYMEEVCRESREFDKEFESLTPEEQKEMETVQKTYRSQCTMAAEECGKCTPE